MSSKRNAVVRVVMLMAILSVLSVVGNQTALGKERPQVITVALEKDMGSLDAGSVAGMWTPTFLVYDPLVHLSRDLQCVPGLAASWKMSSDGKTWTFKLREGVTFHDGTPFDAQQVRWTIERNQRGNFPKYGYHLVQEMAFPDSHTVVFHLKKPCYTFASEMSMAFNAIRNPKAFDDQDKVQAAVGTGPFKLAKWTPGQEIVFVRNDDYWGGKPALEKVIFKIIPDPETRVMALEAGQVDLVFGQSLSPTHIAVLKQHADIKIVEQVSTNSSVIFFNARKAPFDDLRLRKALHYGIDVQGLVAGLLGSTMIPARAMFSDAFKSYINPQAVGLPYDPQKARTLLAEAGWKDTDGDGILDKDSRPLRVTMTYDVNNAGYRLLAEPIQSQLKAIGIDLVLNKVEYGVYYKLLRNKQFDLLLVGQWYIPHNEPWQVYKNYFTPKGYSSVAADAEVAEMVAALEKEMDGARRIEMHHRLQAYIMDHVLSVNIFYNRNLWPMAKKVQGFSPYMDFWHQYRPLEKTSIK